MPDGYLLITALASGTTADPSCLIFTKKGLDFIVVGSEACDIPVSGIWSSSKFKLKLRFSDPIRVITGDVG